VGVETSKGMTKELVIERGTIRYQLTLDYEGIPFRCGQCHNYRHFKLREF
jgi:pyruvate-formate lyase-activating enzyme